MIPQPKPLVLFLCTANSARSQIAEAILRSRAGDRFEVASAGLSPTSVHPMTLSVLAEQGLPTESLRSKPTTDFLGQVKVRFAIVVCEQANQSCPKIFPFAGSMLYWPFPDPAAAVGTPEQRLAAFRAVRDQIADRIDQWLASPPLASASGADYPGESR